MEWCKTIGSLLIGVGITVSIYKLFNNEQFIIESDDDNDTDKPPMGIDFDDN